VPGDPQNLDRKAAYICYRLSGSLTIQATPCNINAVYVQRKKPHIINSNVFSCIGFIIICTETPVLLSCEVEDDAL
jgi:hypothetical protein